MKYECNGRGLPEHELGSLPSECNHCFATYINLRDKYWAATLALVVVCTLVIAFCNGCNDFDGYYFVDASAEDAQVLDGGHVSLLPSKLHDASEELQMLDAGDDAASIIDAAPSKLDAGADLDAATALPDAGDAVPSCHDEGWGLIAGGCHCTSDACTCRSVCSTGPTAQDLVCCEHHEALTPLCRCSP